MRTVLYNGFDGADQCGYDFFEYDGESWLIIINLPETRTSTSHIEIRETIFWAIAQHENVDLADYQLAEYYRPDHTGSPGLAKVFWESQTSTDIVMLAEGTDYFEGLLQSINFDREDVPPAPPYMPRPTRSQAMNPIYWVIIGITCLAGLVGLLGLITG
jgi:hypothetical protein